MSDTDAPNRAVDLTNTDEIDAHIIFHEDDQVMEVRLGRVHFRNTADVNRFYDRIEERIDASGESLWFFLVDYSGAHIDPGSWFAYSRRGKELNHAHSMGSVRCDASDVTRRQIERDAGTENFDPSLFADRDAALAHLRTLPTKRVRKIVHTATFTHDDLKDRLRFLPGDQIVEFDFHGIHLNHAVDVDMLFDHLTGQVEKTGQRWYFLIDYAGFRIMSGAWVRYAARGKTLNEAWSLGSVRFAPGSETETDIRLRAESQGFRPNIRNTRDEALARIDEMKAERSAQG